MLLDREYRDSVAHIGADWANTGSVPPELNTLWRELIEREDFDLGLDSKRQRWTHIAMRLMAISDEASSGMGFLGHSTFARVLSAQYIEHLRNPANRFLPYIPYSICMMVPHQEICVLPKSNTPQVGCTFRSLSHNLAILPPERTVAISWLYNIFKEAPTKPFNVLLVPFPYTVRGRDFARISKSNNHSDDQYFMLSPNWLSSNGKRVSAKRIARFLCELIVSARREMDEVHAVVLPECALDAELTKQVASALASHNPELELFITGTISRADASNLRNYAEIYYLHEGRVINQLSQSKHHRWCLEGQQISRYHLGHVLDPSDRWWEQIHVHGRAVAVSVVRDGASIAVLVCEDLARHDPVMPSVQAVGPNLVIALLMDGPQLERRWPGRYATILAEDPGSSVLTLTCLGMVHRSSMPGEHARREIALWKERSGEAKELRLPEGDLGLLLCLTLFSETQTALDGRSDRGTSRQFRLSGVRGIRPAQTPTWLDL
jgi:hypothetical protein